ncbi:MAG: family 1 glycosylhydrolase [bacterium]|nr:family 1 glycosylhydrolase [bacterium]
MSLVKFPNGFLWGAGSSAQQVEGNMPWNNWAVWEACGHTKDKTGRATDHYRRYAEDIDLLASLGLNTYRFSIEWSRIEPVRGKINKKELRHYGKVLRYLAEKKIMPFVTLYHFTLPLWADPEDGKNFVADFARFARLIADEFGGMIPYFVTINEPKVVAKQNYILGNAPPGKKDIKTAFRVLDTFIEAHNAAYDTIRKHAPNASVGMAECNDYYFPAYPDSILDVCVTNLNREIWNHYFFRRTVFDFIGVNYYLPRRLRFNVEKGAREDFFAENVPGGFPKTDIGWDMCPEGLANVLCDLKQYDKPVIVTESGVPDRADAFRADYVKRILAAILEALYRGVDVRGHIYWSLTDNYEWGDYNARFGLIEIDYTTQKRTVRESAKAYGEIAQNNALVV